MISILPILLFAGIIATIWFLCKVWFRALTSVMATEDDQLPAKHDKALWVALFLFVPIFAPFIYTACVERFNKKRNP
ncbi:MAG: hypothetical protein KAR40_16360 [Candidatus Sabulitectum sp.]|nr:hypothetical protein [Candidatus Sabulitectum sp.]